MRRVRGHEMARATLENAVLDLIAKRKDLPLHALLGAPRKKILSGISIGIQDSPAALVAAVEDAVAKKYHRVKMKVKKGKDVDYVARGARAGSRTFRSWWTPTATTASTTRRTSRGSTRSTS